MGKRSQRLARRQENIGCMWGLIGMLYFRRDAKFLLDRKQGSRRHTFGGLAGRRHSRKKSRDFEEIDEYGEDNIEECDTRKQTVKRLMEDELGKVKQVKKIPNEEVQRILADLGHDVCLEKSSMQSTKQNRAKSHSTSTAMASPSGLLDPSGSKSMKQAEEDDLELSLADFVGELYGYRDDCKNKSELCPELKSHIHTKLSELKSVPCQRAYEESPDWGQREHFYEKYICDSRSYQSNKLVDAPDMLSPEKELFLKTLQKPSPHTLEKENTQNNQNRQVVTKLEPRKILEKGENTKNSKQHEVAIKTHSKEGRNIFFWRKDKSIIKGTSEGTNSSKMVNKIVILKPNPRGIDTTVATASTCLDQQSCTIQSPKYSATESSKFSIKEVRRRFKIVTGDTRRGRPSVYEDDLQRDSQWINDSVFKVRTDSKQSDKDNLRPSTNGKQKQRNDGLGEINGDIITSKDTSIFYEEAKKHLTGILEYNSHTTKPPTVHTSKSLIGMLSLPQRNASSPRSSPRLKGCIDLSPEEINISAIQQDERTEYTKERNLSDEDSGSVACGNSEVLDGKADQDRYSMKQETAQDGDIMHIEEIDKPACSETICSEGTTLKEQCTCNSPLELIEGAEPGREHAGMLLSYPENLVESLEHQEPKTPRSSASLELISQISSERNHEKQEQPSPVSVLDPFFHEDVDSSDRETMIKRELYQDMIRPHIPDVISDQWVFWEDEDARLSYIKAMLELSELCTYQNLEVWYLEDELISPCLVEELHQGNQTDDLKLPFDCICEAITIIQETYFRNPPCLSFLMHKIQPPPMGENLIQEINKHIERHLHNQFPRTLNQLVNIDLEDGTWMNLQSDSEEIIVDTWEFMLDELLEEVANDLLI
ncbi:uncharacterized protein LOC127766574 [Oryza glaberrima]|uniref:DUF4378 domain-containing protein n=2 Tax=Oryza TaxID=4527 RepID=A0A0D3FCP6_9ORYZ|nr:uncharacterized protein LOC127766574 [Oryza glaberrima]XP_052147614.1 uncharacterized protein LOC127766574 [Oryza glaberrima]